MSTAWRCPRLTMTRPSATVLEGLRRPEEQLLLDCVRRVIAPSEVDARTPRVTSPLDWQYLVWLATRHQVLPLLHRVLLALDIPLAARASIQRELHARVARNQRLAAELLRLLRLAAGANLAWLPFKGPALAVGMYGDLALRQFADLDFLVDAAQVARSEELLRSLGYHPRGDYEWEAHFIHHETGLCVDLHRGRLTSDDFPVPVDFRRLWARREPVLLEGERVETLSVDDLLVVLCIQVARDAWQGKTRLGKICDIAYVLKAGDRLSWPSVDAEAGALRVRRVVQFGVLLAGRIAAVSTSAPLPLSTPPGLAALVRQEELALFDDPAAPPPSRVRGHLCHFHLRERWRDKVQPYRARALGMLLPTRLDREALALPPALSWMYYVLRPFLLLWRYGRYLMRGRLE